MKKIINGDKLFDIYGKEFNFHDGEILQITSIDNDLKFEIRTYLLMINPETNKFATIFHSIVTLIFKDVEGLDIKEIDTSSLILELYFEERPVENCFKVNLLNDISHPIRFKCKEIEIKSIEPVKDFEGFSEDEVKRIHELEKKSGKKWPVEI